MRSDLFFFFFNFQNMAFIVKVWLYLNYAILRNSDYKYTFTVKALFRKLKKQKPIGT